MAALAKVENSGVDEFVTLVKSGILTTEPENGLDAVNQYNDYKTLVALLGELFPTSPQWKKLSAWQAFQKISNGEVGEFAALIENGTVSRGEGEGDPVYAMIQYHNHKSVEYVRGNSIETLNTDLDGVR